LAHVPVHYNAGPQIIETRSLPEAFLDIAMPPYQDRNDRNDRNKRNKNIKKVPSVTRFT
jgi:hypothetical protein